MNYLQISKVLSIPFETTWVFTTLMSVPTYFLGSCLFQSNFNSSRVVFTDHLPQRQRKFTCRAHNIEKHTFTSDHSIIFFLNQYYCLKNQLMFHCECFYFYYFSAYIKSLDTLSNVLSCWIFLSRSLMWLINYKVQ